MLQKALSGDAFTRADYEFCENAASQSTTRELAADTAERDIDKLFIAAYMEQFLGQDFDGEVSGVQAFGLFVSLPNGAEGLIRIESLPGYFEYDDQKMALTNRAGVRYTIGTPVCVRLVAANRASGQIDFVLTPTSHGKVNETCPD
jgi:ribonuclease R